MQRRLVAAVAAFLFAITTAASVMAGVPHEVDQSALQPPLNPTFTYRCFERGDGILCQGTRDESWTNEDTGLICGAQPVYTTGTGHERLSRWHLADGRATRTIVQLHYDEVWSLSPTGSGQTVRVRGDWNRHYTYPVPGSLGERVLTEVGAIWNITAPGYGVVAHDTGHIQYAPGADFDEAAVLHGPKDFWLDFDSALGRVCDVLGS